MENTWEKMRTQVPKIYSQGLLNNLFRHSCTKIEFVEKELEVSRATAGKYLDLLVAAGIVRKQKRGRRIFISMIRCSNF